MTGVGVRGGRVAPRSGFALIELALVLVILAILAATVLPNYMTARSEARLAGCIANERTIATALEMYRIDNGGQCPPTLDMLKPNYLAVMPTCPSAGADVYTAGYVSTSIWVTLPPGQGQGQGQGGGGQGGGQGQGGPPDPLPGQGGGPGNNQETVLVTSPDPAYTIVCQGSFHVERGMPVSYPQYVYGLGLQEGR